MTFLLSAERFFVELPPEEALGVCKAKLSRHEDMFSSVDADHPSMAHSYRDVGIVLNNTGQHGEAEGMLRRSMAISEKKEGGPIETRADAAHFYKKKGAEINRMPVPQKLAAFQKRWAELEVAKTYTHLASSLSQQGKLSDAESLHRKVFSMREERLRPHHNLQASACSHLGHVLSDQGKLLDAERFHRKAVACHQFRNRPKDRELARSFSDLGSVMMQQDRVKGASDAFSKANKIHESRLLPERMETYDDLAGSCEDLGAALMRREDKAEMAETLRARAGQVREMTKGRPAHEETLAHVASCPDLTMGGPDSSAMMSPARGLLGLGNNWPQPRPLGPPSLPTVSTNMPMESSVAMMSMTSQSSKSELPGLEATASQSPTLTRWQHWKSQHGQSFFSDTTMASTASLYS